MAAAIMKGTEGKIYIQEPDSLFTHADIPSSGLSLTAPAAANQVGRVESFTVRIANNVEEYFGTGDRDATDIKEGNRSISGTLNRAMINGMLYALALGDASNASPAVITSQTNDILVPLELELKITQPTNYFSVWLQKVKFDNHEFTVNNAGDTIIENMDWKGVFKSSQFVGTPAAGI